METELLNCPFCNGKAVYVKGHADWVSCTNCDATGPNPSIVGGMNQVEKAWNTRDGITKND